VGLGSDVAAATIDIDTLEQGVDPAIGTASASVVGGRFLIEHPVGDPPQVQVTDLDSGDVRASRRPEPGLERFVCVQRNLLVYLGAPSARRRSAWRLDPVELTWERLGDLPVGEGEPLDTAATDDLLLVSDQRSTWVFDGDDWSGPLRGRVGRLVACEGRIYDYDLVDGMRPRLSVWEPAGADTDGEASMDDSSLGELADAMVKAAGQFTLNVVSLDADVATAVLGAAREALFTVAHPEEPDDPYVSYVSEVREGPDGPEIAVDAADLDAYPEVADQLAASMVSAARSVRADAVLIIGPP